MPLTHLKPPAPTRDLHIGEVAEYAEKFAKEMDEFLAGMLNRIMYPRTTWIRGTGNSASGAVVRASSNAQNNDPGAQNTPYEAGNLPVSTSAVVGRAVVLANWVGDEVPVPQRRAFFDGVLVGSPVPSTVMPAVPPSRPTPPSPPAVEDEDTYHQYVTQWGDYFADLVRWFVEDQLTRHWDNVTRYWWGTVSSVNVGSRTATVRLDALGDTEQVEHPCGFGTHLWSAAQISGKRVRVAYDRRVGWWIDDVD